MSEENTQDDKEFEPTQKRLEDARRRGEGFHSTEVAAAATYAGFLVACLGFGPSALAGLLDLGRHLLADAPRLSREMMAAPAAATSAILWSAIWSAAPFFLLPALSAFIALAAQRAFVLAPEKLAPQLSRMSPLAGLRRKFGAAGLFDFAKSVVKMAAACGVLLVLLHFSRDDIVASLYVEPTMAAGLLTTLLVSFLMVALAESVVVGALDAIWQRHAFRRRNRMSRKEMMDELRQSEGDPQLKSSRQARATEIATNRMMLDVPRADVVIVNPTHYAVALEWKRGQRSAPICTAKGVDEVAARIRARAAESGVPIHHDPATARALHASVAIGDQIRPEQYRAVAAAIRFAEGMRRKAGQRG